MMKLIPSTKDLKKYGVMAIGGIAGEMGSKLVKENLNVPVLSEYPIIVDILFMVGGIALSNAPGISELGMGMAVSATSNVILAGYEMIQPKTVPVNK
ncbi:MAG: hypothetical protein IE890_00890 [Arcobacter sp.]|nr:hypothetical protein [Arcobacter sp.]